MDYDLRRKDDYPEYARERLAFGCSPGKCLFAGAGLAVIAIVLIATLL